MEIGVRYLGWVIPLPVSQRDGSRVFSTPGPGKCVECETSRARVYIRWDSKPYCQNCLDFDIAGADPSDTMKREQKHPPVVPLETPYAIDDRLDPKLDVYRRAFS